MEMNTTESVKGKGHTPLKHGPPNPELFSEQTTLNKIRSGLTYFAILSLLQTDNFCTRELCDKLAACNIGPYKTGQLDSYLLKIVENGYIARYKENKHIFYRLLEPGYTFLAQKTQEIQQMIQGIG